MYISTKLTLKVSRDFRNVADFSFFVLFIIWKFKALAPGGALPRIFDRGVQRRTVNPNPI